MTTRSLEKQHSKLSLATIATLITILGGCVGLVGSCLALVFIFKPDLQPDPPPAEMGATLSFLDLEYNVTLEQYAVTDGAVWKIVPSAYSPDQLQVLGAVLSFHAEIKGFKNRMCTLQWTLYNADNQAHVPGYADFAWGTLTPDAAVDSISEKIWIPYPAESGNYLVRLEIVDDKGVRLATVDSEVFTYTK